jgi:hypothetical protein
VPAWQCKGGLLTTSYSPFATNVTSTQREIIQGEYQFNKRWSASVKRDENGGFAVDGISRSVGKFAACGKSGGRSVDERLQKRCYVWILGNPSTLAGP